MQFIKQEMPMYTHDHAAYVRQMYDWHVKMAQYQDQLRAFHLERAKQFQKMAEERAKTSEIPSGTSAA
ncbi:MULTISPECIES: hypothetical protein [Paenibacillaceae]|jgi:hypothetical protein|uniref:Uncharacterized protein n=1 Tax=Aneurinibacillus aneurinilyticus ATCC 12856 TaxID=649747 RepID=U1WYJ0_ANEAE|nr:MULTISPECIES: hypothetical protein [Paenibacillaceae]ERI07313.1 hypothetical protein HMPREF0083_04597 [Aneurinibacillus aneurinilyticus ATCC 12856]MED0709709.1 hypothetical protein [Aneurinibacillus aneurinilyticus]MED0726469.1 hypothetical protein [Aneurinibacillus aneurinilyticus]MED0734941.1 hypothetical protein [Aneurinibacillus aneurinilyticus]MED0741821.1 hypothetical protein [Aneurinibacillus aneurinilyticus]